MLLYPPGLQNGRDVVDLYFSCWFVRINLKCRTDREGFPREMAAVLFCHLKDSVVHLRELFTFPRKEGRRRNIH